MTYVQANRSIKIASTISLVGIIAAFFLPYLNEIVNTGHLRNYMPWLFPGLLQLTLLIQACLLTFMLYKKSRLGAILLLFVFLNDKLFMLISLHGFGTLYIVTWLLTNLIYIIIFILATWGTFAHRHLTARELAEDGSIVSDMKMLWRGRIPLRRAFWAYVGGGIVAVIVISTSTPAHLTTLPLVSLSISLLAVLLQYVYLPAACIGTWRSAKSYEGKSLWPVLAKIALLAVALLIIISIYAAYVLISGNGAIH